MPLVIKKTLDIETYLLYLWNMETPHADLDYARFFFEEPNILVILFNRDTDIDELKAVEILGKILELTKGEPHALIYDFNKNNIIIREITRKISGVRDERTAKLICRAFVASSLQNKLESKHYIQAGKPSADTNYFDTRAEALKWAKEKLKAFTRIDRK